MAHFHELSRVWGTGFHGDYRKRKMDELKAKEPTADLWNTAIDMTDAPRFQYVEEALGGRVHAALPAFAVLLGYCVALFAAAYVAFARYDAR
jgi:hypothetical protein